MEEQNNKGVTLNPSCSVCVPVGGNCLNQNLKICTNAAESIPVAVPPADSFYPYVQRAETAASNAESAAQKAQEIVSNIPDTSALQDAFINAQSGQGTISFTRINGQSQSVSVSAAEVGNLSIVQRNQAYQIGDIGYSFEIPSWGFLMCTVAGITAPAPPTFPQIEGNSYSDGSTVWMLCRKREEPIAEAVTDSQISSLF